MNLPNSFHFGTTKLHPNNSLYILGQRNENYIFRPDKLLLSFQNALQFIYYLDISKKKILFISTRKHISSIVKETALQSNQLFITNKWSGGQLTNKLDIAPEEINCIILLDTNDSILKEARNLKVPIIALVNSNTNPIGINYPVVGNTMSFEFVHFFLNSVLKILRLAKS